MWTELFVLLVVLFVCIVGSGFVAWSLKKVPWWLTGVIATAISVLSVCAWELWLYDWDFQPAQQELCSVLAILFILVCSVIPVLLSAFVGSRTKQAWRVALYGFAIFSTMFLVEIVILAVYIDQTGLL